MDEQRLLRGRKASPGLAAGRVAVLSHVAASRRVRGDAQAEAAALHTAIDASLAEITTLAEAAQGDAAGILGFQVAMLSDDELWRPALTAIADGTAADAAWAAAVDDEIAGYAEAEDEYFRARSADLQDIRDRVLGHLGGATPPPLPAGSIVAADDMPPSRFLAMDWSGGGLILGAGSPSSHVAMLARARGVPMVVDIGAALAGLDGRLALLDAEAGTVVLDPSDAERQAFAARERDEAALAARAAILLHHQATTADGVRIAVQLNVSDPAELAGLSPAICDGIGLVRTEFLFHRHAGLPDEAAQFAIYRDITVWAAGRPVTFRTLDAGGDKPIPGLTHDDESNPFLGVRGIRLSLLRPEIFRVQLRALARAAAHGAVKIMLPMVTLPEEIAAARAMLAEEIAALAAAGVTVGDPPLGIMVEVPAAAIAVDRLDADFFSIGSNDLTQYVMAAARDIAGVADFADPLNPAVLRLIATVARHGGEIGREVSLCGDAAADPAVLPHLLRAGLRNVSVAPPALARAKLAISTATLADAAR